MLLRFELRLHIFECYCCFMISPTTYYYYFIEKPKPFANKMFKGNNNCFPPKHIPTYSGLRVLWQKKDGEPKSDRDTMKSNECVVYCAYHPQPQHTHFVILGSFFRYCCTVVHILVSMYGFIAVSVIHGNANKQ